MNETTGPRIWGRVLASAEKATDAFLVSDLLHAMSHLPPAQIAPLLSRMARCAQSMEPIHRQPSTMISIANAQLLAGGTACAWT